VAVGQVRAIVALTTGLLVAVLLVPVSVAADDHGAIEVISLTPDGKPAGAERWPGPRISGDGQVVAFTSSSGDLVPGDRNGRADAFVRDRVAGLTERVSASFDRETDICRVDASDISADGRVVAMTVSYGAPGCGVDHLGWGRGPRQQVFVHDRSTNRTELVSATPAGTPGDDSSWLPSITGDGRLVAFLSQATDLAAGDRTGVQDVLVRDRVAGTTRVVNVLPAGAEDGAPVVCPRISADGRSVSFQTHYSFDDMIGSINPLYVRDLLKPSASSIPGDADGYCPTISSDGRQLAFVGSAPQAGADRWGRWVHDRDRGSAQLVAERSSYLWYHWMGATPLAVLSGDGRAVAFFEARDPVPHRPSVFLHDRDDGVTRRISPAAAEDRYSWAPAVNGDGKSVAFLLGVGDEAQVTDVLVWDAEARPGVPSVPRDVVARRAGSGAALVSWSPPWTLGGHPVDRYVVRTARDDGPPQRVPDPVTVDGSTLQARVEGLEDGVGYRFAVSAVNALGEGPASGWTNAVVPRPAADVSRLAGSDRFATAVAVSARSYPDGASVVYVATGGNYPDALAGAVAAVRDGGPVLLVRRDELPAVTAAEVERLGPERIVVLGGKAAVSSPVVVALQEHAAVSRLAGEDRFATAALVADTFVSASVAYVATGENFPDALAGSAVAAATGGGPILLVRRDVVPAATAVALRRLGPQRIVILGGTAAVSEQVRRELAAIAPVSRLAGENRYATAAVIAATVEEAESVFVATGVNFPDALVGGAAAALVQAPLLLVTATDIPQVTDDQLGRLQPRRIHILGGPAAIDESVHQELAR
jgi:putative cell wall-binding protein/Tol biopolymer transport system component